MAWLRIWFGISNTFGGAWSDRVGQNRETDEEHDEDCFEKEFKLDSVKFATDSQRGRETLGMGSCSINT